VNQKLTSTVASLVYHFGLPWVRPWDNRGKCHMDEKRTKFSLSHRLMKPQLLVNKKDGYRQRNVRHFLQSAKGTFWPPLGTPLGQSR